MTVTKYFTLTNSDMSLSRKFRVLHAGWDPIKEKSQTTKKTLNGEWDVSSGGTYARHEYVLRVHGTDPEAGDGYGSKAELDTFFSYDTPNPISGPSNKLNLVDHLGNEYIVIMAGDFAPKVLGAAIEGLNAVFTVKCVFLILETVGPS